MNYFKKLFFSLKLKLEKPQNQIICVFIHMYNRLHLWQTGKNKTRCKKFIWLKTLIKPPHNIIMWRWISDFLTTQFSEITIGLIFVVNSTQGLGYWLHHVTDAPNIRPRRNNFSEDHYFYEVNLDSKTET